MNYFYINFYIFIKFLHIILFKYFSSNQYKIKFKTSKNLKIIIIIIIKAYNNFQKKMNTRKKG